MIERKKSLEKISFATAIMFGVYWIYLIFIETKLDVPQIYKTIIGLASLYGIGLILFLSTIKSIPSKKILKYKISFKTIFKCFLLQFTAVIILNIITIVTTIITGNEINNEINTLTPYAMFMLLVFNPIIEEFVFRKLFADKLLQYGELFYILVSSFCFALVHGVSQGLPQVAYTFVLGLIWSYLFAKSGNIIIPILLHSISNLFAGIMIQILQGISIEIFGVYFIFMILLGIFGLIWFIKSKNNIILDNKNKISDKSILKEMATNKGILIYVILTITIIIFKNIV